MAEGLSRTSFGTIGKTLEAEATNLLNVAFKKHSSYMLLCLEFSKR